MPPISASPVWPNRDVAVVVVDDADFDARRLDPEEPEPTSSSARCSGTRPHDPAFGAAVLIEPMEAVAVHELPVQLLGQPCMDGEPMRWSRSFAGSPFSKSAMEAMDRISVASCATTTSQNRETLKRRIATMVPREASEVMS